MLERKGPFLVLKTTDEDLENLHKWDAQWTAELALRKELEEGSPPPPEAGHSRVKNVFDPEVKVGDVRILPPALLGDTRLRKVVVLKEIEDGFQVAPLSVLQLPAVQGELKAREEAEGVPPDTLVVQAWNMIYCSRDILSNTWLDCTRYTDQEVEDSWSVFLFLLSLKELPENLSDRIGLPIFAEDDPRTEYQTVETHAFDCLRCAALESESGGDDAEEAGAEA